MDSLKVNICNEALAHISSSRIQRLDEPASEARASQTAFDRVLRDMLESANWIFARKISTLALVRTEEDGYFVYAKPTDCIFAIRVFSTVMQHLPRSPKFMLIGNEIYSRVQAARLEYTSKDVDMENLSSLFRTALTHRLAAEIAKELTGDIQLATMQYQLYVQSFAEARQKNAVQDNQPKPQANPYVDCR